MDFGDYLIFVDESGDHGLKSIDPEFPVFALVFVLIKKEDYVQTVVPAFQRLKCKYWGHDQIILHENDIRKEKGYFGLLRTNADLRKNFYNDLASMLEVMPFEYCASIIDKEKLKKRYPDPFSPYEISLLFCMERVFDMLLSRHQGGKRIHLIIEGRGVKEDRDLELEFHRIINNQSSWGCFDYDFQRFSFEMVFTDKRSNSSGLQLADLLARPTALHFLRPQQKNRAWEIIVPKLKRYKCFPKN